MDEIVFKLVYLCDLFQKRFNLSNIIVCQLLPRSKTCHVEKTLYNQLIKSANQNVKKLTWIANKNILLEIETIEKLQGWEFLWWGTCQRNWHVEVLQGHQGSYYTQFKKLDTVEKVHMAMWICLIRVFVVIWCVLEAHKSLIIYG